jgi:hypothetical protein
LLMNNLLILCIVMGIACATLAVFLAAAIYRRKIHIWLPEYLKQTIPVRSNRLRVTGTKHILFCFVDHFEPGWNKAELEVQNARVEAWIEKYPGMAMQFADSEGFHPKHTWFYPPHYFREEYMLKLIGLCRHGFGEIEMHLHHNRMDPFPDTSETLKMKILNCVALYSRYGIFKTTENGIPVLRYAFIHGDWALDNSRTGFCGVNDEITILKESGCYADFTFPSYMVESQPRCLNTIYYAKDDPVAPKSYDTGVPVSVGGTGLGDLMLIQGPLGLRWRGRSRWYSPSVDDGEISKNNPPSQQRVDFWIKSGIHVAGRPNWVIVKVFTHGAPLREHQTLLDEPIKMMHRYLCTAYNNGSSYRLHYVAARELYNIIKAAELNLDGDPGQYRNLILSPYEYVDLTKTQDMDSTR